MTRPPSEGTIPANERWDRAFELFSAEPRRVVIYSLTEAAEDQWLSLPAAAMSPNMSIDRKDLGLHLKHLHLPKLAESGYVTWRDEPFSVRRGPNFDEAAAALETVFSSIDALPPKLVRGCKVLEELRKDD